MHHKRNGGEQVPHIHVRLEWMGFFRDLNFELKYYSVRIVQEFTYSYALCIFDHIDTIADPQTRMQYRWKPETVTFSQILVSVWSHFQFTNYNGSKCVIDPLFCYLI